MHKQRHYLDYMENTNTRDLIEVVREAVALNEIAGSINPYKGTPESFNEMGEKLTGLYHELSVLGDVLDDEKNAPEGLNEALDAQSIRAKAAAFILSLQTSIDHLAGVVADMRRILVLEGREALNRKLDEARQIHENGLTDAIQEAAQNGTFTTTEEFFAKHGKTFVPYVAKEVE